MGHTSLVFGGAECGASVGNAVFGADLEVSHHFYALEPGGHDLPGLGVLFQSSLGGGEGQLVGNFACYLKLFSRGTRGGRAARDRASMHGSPRRNREKHKFLILVSRLAVYNLTLRVGKRESILRPRPINAPGRRGPSRWHGGSPARIAGRSFFREEWPRRAI